MTMCDVKKQGNRWWLTSAAPVLICGIFALVWITAEKLAGHSTEPAIAKTITPTSKEARRLIRIDPPELTADVDEDTTHVDYTFSVINDSSEPVSIESTKPLCSCTVYELSSSLVPPFGSATFHVQYAVGRQFGALDPKEIRLLTNSEPHRVLSCRVGGVRRRRFDIRPSEVVFGKVVAGDRVSQLVTIAATGVSFALDSIRTSDARLSVADVHESYVDGKKSIQFRVDFEATSGIGLFEGFVNIPQIDEMAPVATIPIRATVSDVIELVPSTAFFGVVTVGQTPTRTIRAHLAGKPASSGVTILSVKTPRDVYKHKLNTDDASMELIFIPSTEPPGLFQDEVEVVCRFEKKDYQLRLPVRAMIRRTEVSSAPLQ